MSKNINSLTQEKFFTVCTAIKDNIPTVAKMKGFGDVAKFVGAKTGITVNNGQVKRAMLAVGIQLPEDVRETPMGKICRRVRLLESRLAFIAKALDVNIDQIQLEDK